MSNFVGDVCSLYSSNYWRSATKQGLFVHLLSSCSAAVEPYLFPATPKWIWGWILVSMDPTSTLAIGVHHHRLKGPVIFGSIQTHRLVRVKYLGWEMRLSGLQREVLSLFRKCLRETRRKPKVGRPMASIMRGIWMLTASLRRRLRRTLGIMLGMLCCLSSMYTWEL